MKAEKQTTKVTDQLIDELLKEGRKPEDVDNILKQLTKAVLERALRGEMDAHLGYVKHDPAGNNSGNSRNGATTKTLKGDFGKIELETPRDRNGDFEPQIIRKNQSRWTGFDDKVLSMYARGMTTREPSPLPTNGPRHQSHPCLTHSRPFASICGSKPS